MKKNSPIDIPTIMDTGLEEVHSRERLFMLELEILDD